MNSAVGLSTSSFHCFFFLFFSFSPWLLPPQLYSFSFSFISFTSASSILLPLFGLCARCVPVASDFNLQMRFSIHFLLLCSLLLKKKKRKTFGVRASGKRERLEDLLLFAQKLGTERNTISKQLQIIKKNFARQSMFRCK